MQIYVIEWSAYDNSGSGVVSYAYTDIEEAKRTLQLLQDHGTQQYALRELKLLGA